MPAAGKMSSASMNAEPTMPNTTFTSRAASVSTKASEGVIRRFSVVMVMLRSRVPDSGRPRRSDAAAAGAPGALPSVPLVLGCAFDYFTTAETGANDAYGGGLWQDRGERRSAIIDNRSAAIFAKPARVSVQE